MKEYRHNDALVVDPSFYDWFDNLSVQEKRKIWDSPHSPTLHARKMGWKDKGQIAIERETAAKDNLDSAFGHIFKGML